jgi:2-dehydropantoate 2-reductase
MFDQPPTAMRSSTQRDAEANRPTELDAIGGAALRTARRHGLDTPATKRIVNELQARETASTPLQAGNVPADTGKSG